MVDELPVPTGEAARSLTAAFARLRKLSAAERPKRDSIESAQQELEGIAWTFLNRTTPATYMEFGRLMARRFVNAIKIRIRDKYPLSATTTHPRDETFLSQVGTFTRDALADGWEPTKLGALTDCMFRALYLRDWMRPVAKRIAIQDYSAPIERYCELRWQVERGMSLALSTRLSALNELKNISAYPAHFNRLALLLNAGQFESATHLLETVSGREKEAFQKQFSELKHSR